MLKRYHLSGQRSSASLQRPMPPFLCCSEPKPVGSSQPRRDSTTASTWSNVRRIHPLPMPSIHWPCDFPPAMTGSLNSSARTRTLRPKQESSTRRSSLRSPRSHRSAMPPRSRGSGIVSVQSPKSAAILKSSSPETLRALLKVDSEPFDPRPSFEIYQQVLGPIEGILRSKPRLSFVFNAALTSLPPQVLVARDPAGKALKDVDWLIRSHAVTVLPSVASLQVLRGKVATASAEKPLIGFADPIFDRDLLRLQQNTHLAANVTPARGMRGAVADIEELKTALPRLPDTATELRQVAASVKAAAADVVLGLDATETRVKQAALDQYRIVYFATHGLLAGEVAEFAQLNAEPALVLTLPEKPTELDDGLLTASEVAQLKLNADWVVLSACNTAAGGKPGAEALSGLARAFFYAGGRSLLVSNWE